MYMLFEQIGFKNAYKLSKFTLFEKKLKKCKKVVDKGSYI